MANQSLEHLHDSELIELYVKSSDEQAFETLLRRYYGFVYKRFVSYCGQADADDLSQQLWIRVLDNLENYKDEGKFSAFLSTIARNLLNDYWRRAGVRGQVAVEWDDDQFERNRDFASHEGSAEDQVARQEAISYLVTQLIPALPCDQRMIYLLRHESEHWDDKCRLEWNHLAELNGIDESTTWEYFDSARTKMVNNTAVQAYESNVDAEELLIFVVWTQAQRPDKSKKYTESYFANLLGIPVNTLKTRYKAASTRLAEGLTAWKSER